MEKMEVSTQSPQINHMLANSLDTFFTNVENIIRDYSCMTETHTHTHNQIQETQEMLVAFSITFMTLSFVELCNYRDYSAKMRHL